MRSVEDQAKRNNKEIKMLLGKVSLWLIRNHWLWVFLIIGIQYLSGAVLGGRYLFLAKLLSYPTWRQIHMINSNLIIGVTILMVVVKGYLWLVRKQKI